MKIRVFGPGCAKCKEAEANAIAAARESGKAVEVEKISDFKEMMANGIMSTPAVMLDDALVCVGRVPSKAEFLEWISSGKGGDEKSSAGSNSGSCCSCGGNC